jgi:DNA (cytosine-5)-methyltransferase 1
VRFLSVCSGIEAASVAFAPLGWEAVAFAEIEPFPSAVLAHHYPEVPNLGDMNRFLEWPDYAVDVLCGGTPCQSFSVAGLRQGLADPRGNLALTFLAIADRYRPRWIIWENVPGVLSSNGGRDFAAFVGGLGQLGNGWCYRVLDAQYVRVDGFLRAVPQRRRRVWVVGYLGDWRPAAAVLSEPESVLGNSPPRREARAGVAVGALGGTSPGGGWRIGGDEAAAGHILAYGGNDTRGPIEVATAVNAHGGPHGRLYFESETFVAQVAPAISASNPYGDHASREGLLVAHSLRGEGHDASEDGTGRGVPRITISFAMEQSVADCLTANWQRSNGAKAGNQVGMVNPIIYPTAVRRLTPLECERLQGFPDCYTAVPFRGKPAADGPRYQAIGNSWPCNVARWIGRRVELVESVMGEIAVAE